MKSDQNLPKHSSEKDLTPQESMAMDALLDECVGGKTPPEFKEVILKKYHHESTHDDPIPVAVTTVSRSQRQSQRRRRSRRKWASMWGLVIAGSLAAFFFFRPDQRFHQDVAVAKTKVVRPSDSNLNASTPKVSGATDALQNPVKPSNAAVAAELDRTELQGIKNQSRTLSSSPLSISTPDNQTPRGQVMPTPSVMALDEPKEEIQDLDHRVQTPAPKMTPRRPSPLKLVSRDIESDFIKYWKSAGVEPTAEADPSEVATRLSAALGVKVPASALSSHEAAANWLLDKQVGLAIAKTWWNQVTRGNFASLPADAQNRLQSGFARHLQPNRFFNRYLFRLISRTDSGSNDFYASMVPPGSDATHPDMIASLASLTMNKNVSCTRCHDSMVGGNYGQREYWGFAAVIDRGLRKASGKLVRVENESAKEIFYETSDRRGEVTKPDVPDRWLGIESSASLSNVRFDSISRWSSELKQSPILAEGIVNSIWKLVHGRPIIGQAAHPMSAPMSDELLNVQKNLVDDLIRSGFDLRRTLAIVMLSPTNRRSTPESLRDVWATDQSESHKKVVAFAGALPTTQAMPLLTKLDQSMRAIGSVMSVDGRTLLAQIGEDGAVAKQRKVPQTLAWDFPDQADSLPVQWLQSVKGVDAKVAHLCYLAGHEQVPKPIRHAANAMRKAKVDAPTLLHRVWWMAKEK
jgi:hypothetical protein